ncbi:MAG: 23S rRNA (uracil(1939)-C(5))-methyltransferase RlmD [Pseudomonadales bacterium]|nr:23S rRNA (uracil(1939)-C(5))-methyltransferase RlmD [Pseudomonadales bacterium]
MTKKNQKSQAKNRNNHRSRHKQTNAQKSGVRNSQRNSKPVPKELVVATIEKLSHDGRGVARIGGKTTFVDGALAGESIEFRYVKCHGRYDEAVTVRVLEPSSERVTPPCQHADVCGGCSLQHLSTDAQISLKQSVLVEQLTHFGDIQPDHVVEPIRGPSEGYRRKARFAIKHEPEGSCIIGFRAKNSARVVPITRCSVLPSNLSNLIPELQVLVSGLQKSAVISHVDLTQGDSVTVLTFRHIKPLTDSDFQSLLTFCQQHLFHLYLQPDSAASIHRVWPDNDKEPLSYTFKYPELQKPVDIQFSPNDFIQVNGGNNSKLVAQAIDFLDLDKNDRVLDLFCGIGNFTLPIATLVSKVVGVEGSDHMVVRAKQNASRNALSNVAFHSADLTQTLDNQPWSYDGFTKVLIDPPRSGALDIIKNIAHFSPEKIVYVSCNPATLARDAGELIQQGYKMVRVGVVDMFPHTTHVESIALFERIKRK